MTLLSWDIPLISFNGSLWDVLLRCSKWLLWAWLDSFTMILRCWLVVWVKWARPLVSMTLWSRVMFNWKAVQLKGRPISWAVLHHWKSMGQILVPSCPQGCNFYPILRYGLTEPASLFKCGKFHISVKSTLWATRRQFFFAMLSQWGKFGTLLPPRGATFTPFWGMVLQSLPASWICGKFHISVKSTFWATRRQSFFSMLSQCVWFCPYFAPGANIVPPIAYKSHSTRFPIRPHVLTPHSWLCDKNCGRSSAPK